MSHGALYDGPAPDGPVASQPLPVPTSSDHRSSLPGAATWLERLDPPWKLAIWLLVVARVGLGMITIFLVHLGGPRIPIGYWTGFIIHGNQPWNQVLSVWQRWDALWYQEIARDGYHATNGTTAFYPLYPFLSRVVSIPLLGNIALAELVVSSISFVCAMWLLYRIARLDVGRAPAYLTVILITIFPTGFFFFAPYSEGLLLALSLAALWFARRDQPWLAGAFGFAAALTRAPGAFLVLPLAFEYLRRRRQTGQHPDVSLLSTLLPVGGWLSFMVYIRTLPGTGAAPVSAESFWQYTLVAPWEALSASWQHIVRLGDVPELLNLVSLIAFTVIAFWVSRRLPFIYSLYVWPFLAVLFTREMGYSPLMSVSRLVLMLFPCFIVLATWLVRRPWLALGCLIVSELAQMTLLTYWVYWWFIA